MARPLDPFRALEVPRDASLDEVKTAYRRLAKLYHPDSAGDRALPRFLAIQAAYEALTEGPAALRLGKNARPRAAAARPARPSEADRERARTTREAAGRGSRARTAPGGTTGRPGTAGTTGSTGSTGTTGPSGTTAGSRPGGAAGTGAPRGGTGSAGTAGTRTGTGRSGSATGRGRRDRRTPGSTSYDGADLEPFEPEWAGASWYGESSGTYWTINPKEFADPRKHGPEYQARGRRAARAAARAAGAGTTTRRADRADPASRPSRPEEAADAFDAQDAASSTTERPIYGPTDEFGPTPGWDAAAPPRDPEQSPPQEPPPTWTPTFESDVREAESARPPFAVFGVFGILMGAIAIVLVLSPAGPASAGFVPIVFLVAILAAAGLVLSGLRGGRRA